MESFRGGGAGICVTGRFVSSGQRGEFGVSFGSDQMKEDLAEESGDPQSKSNQFDASTILG